MKPDRAPALVFVFVTLLIDIVGLGIILPVLPKLIQELTGTGMGDASRIGGWMMFSYAFMQFLFAPIIGGLSDRYGRRPILLLSLFGFGANYLLMALSTHIVFLFAGRMLAGIAGASFTTATAYIADVSPPEKKAQNFGLIGMAFGIGFILGPVLGGLMGQLGTRWPFYAAAALGFLNTAFGYFFLPESLKP
ncbi:MAG: MFS transporter, partial [Bacteroidota bacterium]